MTAKAPPRGWLDAREQRAWRAWLAMSDLLHVQIGRDLQAESGLSEADFAILVYLSESPQDRMRLSDLAAALQWSKSRLSHQFARMEARGLVTRGSCPLDARASYALLTTEGRREIERVAPLHVETVRRHFVDVLTPEQLDALATAAEAVVAHLKSSMDGVVDLPPCPGG